MNETKKYTIDNLQPKPDDIPLPIGHCDTFADAMECAEKWCEQWDEQLYVGIWQGENLVAIFDSNDWYTK